MPERDIFRPHFEPATALYDAMHQAQVTADEATSEGEFSQARAQRRSRAVLLAANDVLERHGLTPVTLGHVMQARHLAAGHIDALSKWCLQILDFGRNPRPVEPRACRSCGGAGGVKDKVCVCCHGEGAFWLMAHPEALD